MYKPPTNYVNYEHRKQQQKQYKARTVKSAVMLLGLLYPSNNVSEAVGEIMW